MAWNHKKGAPAYGASLALGLLLTGCSGGGGGAGEQSDKKPSASSAPHGYIEGAQETAEQQSRLVLADGASGALKVLDLIDGKTRPLGKANGSRLVTDGRFAYAASDTGAHIFDSGAWMVDHGDHVHYYRATMREVGALRGNKPQHIYSSPSSTAVTFADGKARLLDHARMEKGDIGTTVTIEDADAGPVVPFKENVLVPTGGPGDETVVEVRDRKGNKKSALKAKCAQLRGAAVTRTGVVFGCADGALFVSEKNGEARGEKIPFGQSVPDGERPASFRHRSLGSTLTATAGDRGVWVLNVPEREWKLVETGPVTAVNSAGEGAPLLALKDTGVLEAYDVSSGKKIAGRKLVSRMPDAKEARPVIEVDAGRAYVNDVADKKIHEIDFNDDLREARSFSVDFAPSAMVETGR
ncbi:hypothetical protein [Streptomyces sp. NPDC059788]|uniref:hypothetical protein n=1 Tax=Streptomyces sp. NPDC059788 TaxID=3346948 RepID=UPI00364F8A10